MAAGKGKTDVRIDFPLPLLIMGGGTIAVRDHKENDNTDRGLFAGSSNEDCSVQICYSVLNSTPTDAPYSKLKYKYLSAFSFAGGGTTYSGSGVNQFSGDKTVIRPDSASGVWYEDVEIWGCTVMSTENPAGASDGVTARARCKNALGEIVASAAVIKGPSNAIPIPIIPADPGIASTGWTHGFDVGTIAEWRTWAVDSGLYIATLGVEGTMNLPPIGMATTSFKLYDAGSDTQVSMFRYPIYVRGSAADGNTDNFKVSVSGSEAEETKSTWFYRPAKKKGQLHGWI
jgi:hypothetical protein